MNDFYSFKIRNLTLLKKILLIETVEELTILSNG